MTTTEVMQITDGNASTSPKINKFYFRCVVLILGVIGTAANALVQYALVASKQHKVYVLIFNQNALDLFSSVFLIITYAVKIANIRFTGLLGYWVCVIILSEKLIWCGIIGSVINLAMVTVERYLRVVHPAWSKQKLSDWVIYSAVAFTWIASIIYNAAVVFPTTGVTAGSCNQYSIWENQTSKLILFIWKFLSFYVIILCIFIICYWRILVVIRRQIKVMAGHGSTGSGPEHMNKMQISVVKTMILVSAFYAVSWLPTYIYLLLVNLNPNLQIIEVGYYTAEFISWMYICTNPFIYATKFEPVKKILLGLIPCLKITAPNQASESAITSGTRNATTRNVQTLN